MSSALEAIFVMTEPSLENKTKILRIWLIFFIFRIKKIKKIGIIFYLILIVFFLNQIMNIIFASKIQTKQDAGRYNNMIFRYELYSYLYEKLK